MLTALVMAVESIREKKGRSFLTMLGIIIGVCAVLVLVAMVTGYNADLTAYYEKLGVNKVEVDFTFYNETTTPDLTQSLIDYGHNELAPAVTGVTPNISAAGVLKYREKTLDTATVYLGSEDFATCNNYTLSKGRDLSSVDVENRSKVCLIGTYVAQSLFGYASPLDKIIYLNGIPFTVVGVYYQKDGTTAESMDDMAVIPYTLNREFLGKSVVTSYLFKVDTTQNMTAVMNRLESGITNLVTSSVGTAKLTNGNAAMAESNEETASLSVVLGGIAAIALLVGGIGIMNIMLVTVTERTREIGVRKAIGAPRKVIITQFLVESSLLSALGGLIGIGLGFALSAILGKIMYDLVLTPAASITLGAFLFSIVIGVGFGLYPAAKASGLEPVDALRAD